MLIHRVRLFIKSRRRACIIFKYPARARRQIRRRSFKSPEYVDVLEAFYLFIFYLSHNLCIYVVSIRIYRPLHAFVSYTEGNVSIEKLHFEIIKKIFTTYTSFSLWRNGKNIEFDRRCRNRHNIQFCLFNRSNKCNFISAFQHTA